MWRFLFFLCSFLSEGRLRVCGSHSAAKNRTDYTTYRCVVWLSSSLFTLTDLFVENVRTFEQLTQIGQLFAFLVLFLPDPLQSLRQIRNVRAEMFDRLQTVLEITANQQTIINQSNGSVERTDCNDAGAAKWPFVRKNNSWKRIIDLFFFFFFKVVQVTLTADDLVIELATSIRKYIF